MAVTLKMKDWNQIGKEQKVICKTLKVDWVPLDRRLMVAITESIFTDIQPINGLRHLKQKAIDGWYLWSGGEIP